MPDWVPPTLTTARLVLRPVTAADRDAIFAACKNPNVTRFTLFDAHRTPADTDRFLRGYVAASYAKRTPDPFAVTLRHDPEPRLVGCVGCHWADRTNGVLELGYWLAEHLWGRGIATEAAAAVVRFAFAGHPDVQRIQARVIAGNGASERVLQKVGFRPEGTLRKFLRRHGRHEDVAMFSLLRDEHEVVAAK